LVVSLQPWGITFGFTLYGAKIATALGIDLAAFQAPVLDHLVLGAGLGTRRAHSRSGRTMRPRRRLAFSWARRLAAGLSGKWKPSLNGVGVLSILAAILGGC
jgi:hypothetical protein